jgi:hypothetical protein
MTINAYKFGLNDCKIATWSSAESYGTAVDVESIQLMGVEFNTESGQLEGDDIITDTHAKAQSVTVRLRFGFKDLDVVEILTGVTNTESAPNSESMVFGGDNMPYSPFAGRVGRDRGRRDMHIFIPNAS